MPDDTIELIKDAHRRRVYAMEQRKRTDLALGSLLRLVLGWSRALPEPERKAINNRAAGLIGMGEHDMRERARDRNYVPDDPDYAAWRDVILASLQARAPFDAVEKLATKDMERLAKSLPVWPWAEAIRGFGPASLAIIVAEAGDLGNYPLPGEPARKGPGMLWKRMGVALVGDLRQGALPKGAPAAAWIEHGYSRQRRSRLWNIGDALIKGNGDGRYRQCYLARKAYERARAEKAAIQVVPAAKIPKGAAAGFMSEGHVHKRAQRYMEKRLLRDLWQAWRRAAEPLSMAAE